MSRVRGKKRMEIIKKFLEGEEDPDYEVVPTVTKGKYFVRPRKEKMEVEDNDDNDDNDDEDEDNSDIEESSTPVQLSKETKSKKQNPKQKKQLKQKQNPKQDALRQMVHKDINPDIYDPTIPYQILEQLKLLGEEQKLKREKKEQKKLMKHQIQKQLSKKQQKEESSDEEYDYEVVEEEPTQQKTHFMSSGSERTLTNFLRPIPVRRKVNLLK